jgi:diacylglycerol O-acyltransferase / wax synthase
MAVPISPIESVFLNLETDSTRQTIASFCPLEKTPDFELLKRDFQHLLNVFPKLKTKFKKETFWNYWVEDPEFDLNNHLRFISVPHIHSLQQLISEAEKQYQTPLNHKQPLWELLVISNREHHSKSSNNIQDFSAILLKFHHSMVDGLSGLEVLNSLSTVTPQKTLRLVSSRIDTELDPKLPNLLRKVNLWKSFTQLIKDLRTKRGNAGINGVNSSERRISITQIGISELREIKNFFGGSTNDCLLALLAQALRRYALANKVCPTELTAVIPFSTRALSDKYTLGVQISGVGVQLPINQAEFAEQLKQISNQTSTIKKEKSYGVYALATLCLAQFPKKIQQLCSQFYFQNTNFICTNIPLSMKGRYIGGAKVEGNYGLPALMKGHGMGVSLIRLHDKICISFSSDPAIIKNPREIIVHLHQALEEALSQISPEKDSKLHVG